MFGRAANWTLAAIKYNCSKVYNSWESYRDGGVTSRRYGTDMDMSPDLYGSGPGWLSSPNDYECYRCGKTWESRYDDGWITCSGCNKEVWPHNKSSPELSEDSDDEAACYRCSQCYNKWKSYHADGWVKCKDCGHDVWPYNKP